MSDDEMHSRLKSLSKQDLIRAVIHVRQQYSVHQSSNENLIDTISSIVEEHFKKHLLPLTSKISDLHRGYEELSRRVTRLEACANESTTVSESPNEMFEEMMLRQDKRNCLIVAGLPETKQGDRDERQSYDEHAVMGIFKRYQI